MWCCDMEASKYIDTTHSTHCDTTKPTQHYSVCGMWWVVCVVDTCFTLFCLFLCFSFSFYSSLSLFNNQRGSLGSHPANTPHRLARSVEGSSRASIPGFLGSPPSHNGPSHAGQTCENTVVCVVSGVVCGYTAQQQRNNSNNEHNNEDTKIITHIIENKWMFKNQTATTKMFTHIKAITNRCSHTIST